MKKIVCPQCGAINLEKFVTYPHCAGCSALLPAHQPPPHTPFWRRPLRVWLWVVFLGSATIGLLAAAAAFSVNQDEPSLLLVLPQTRRLAGSRNIVVCRFTLDSLSEAPQNLTVLRDVSMRLSRGFERTFHILDVQPRPDAVDTQHGSRTYRYARWLVGEQWILRVRVRRGGEQRLGITVRAADHLDSVQHVTVRTP